MVMFIVLKKKALNQIIEKTWPTQQKYNLTVVVSMGRLWMMILLIKTTHEKNVSRKLYSCLTREKMETIIKDKNKKMEEKNKKVVDFNKPKCPAYSFLIFSSEIIVVAQEPATLTSSSFPSSENGATLGGPLTF
nr:hypothetical protein [Tanacetum cinerariifolium]